MFRLTIENKNLQELRTDVAELHHLLNSNPVSPVVDTPIINEVAGPVDDTPVVEQPAISHKMIAEAATQAVKPNANVPKGDVDKKGIVWDERIHSSSRSQNVDGSWKKRRNVDPSLYNQLIANQKDPQSVNTQCEAKPEPAIVDQPVASEKPAVVAEQPVASEKPAHTFITFKSAAPQVLAALVNNGSITQEYVGQLCEHFKVNQLWEMFTDDAKLRQLYDTFTQYNLVTRLD